MRRQPSAPPELPGYEFVRVIGTGGFSDVFLYEQQLPKRHVAVKVLIADEVSPAVRAAFVAEANLMAQLSTHPYIVSIFHAAMSAEDRPYFVMEYYPGPSFAARYKREPLSVTDALRTGIRLSSAIATAHAAGILHRDIKPGNVLTNAYGSPALTDFGIASALEEEVPSATVAGRGGVDLGSTGTSNDQSVGLSVPWSPPEMFLEQPTADVRSDIFSLAATLHTVLAGRTPFEVPGGPNGTLDLIERIERGAITPMTRSDVPASLTAVLAKGMAVDRADRFATAVDFARALQRVELELGYAATPIELAGLHESSAPVGGDGGEETRVRAVPTVQAQPDSDDRTRLRPSEVVAQGDESTVVRPRLPQVDTAPATDAPTAAPRRASKLTVILTVAALVIVGAVVAGAVIVGGGVQRGPETAPAPTSTGGSAISGSGIRPVREGEATVSPDGTSVTFTWVNPDPREGDTYYWARTETPTARTAVDSPSATVDGVAPGTQVCILVEVNRAGNGSEPTRICTG